MPYISMLRVGVLPGSDEVVERGIRSAFALRKTWQAQGDLLSSRLVRSESGNEYMLVSVWADKGAHDRHEDDPAEQEALRPVLQRFTGRPEEFDGEVIANLD